MSYLTPNIVDFKSQFLGRGIPLAVPIVGGGSGAVVTVTLGGVNGGLASATVTAGGANYPANKLPTVIVQGIGVGAILTPVMAAGVMTNVALTNPGYGYSTTVPPTVYISNGLGDNTSATKVTDYDIASAQLAALMFNMTQTIFGSQAAFTYAYNLLTAHYLCDNLQAGEAGLGGKGEWVTSSKTIGNITESFTIPPRILNSPFLSQLSRTTYGLSFLQFVAPQLIGNVGAVVRRTLP